VPLVEPREGPSGSRQPPSAGLSELRLGYLHPPTLEIAYRVASGVTRSAGGPERRDGPTERAVARRPLERNAERQRAGRALWGSCRSLSARSGGHGTKACVEQGRRRSGSAEMAPCTGETKCWRHRGRAAHIARRRRRIARVGEARASRGHATSCRRDGGARADASEGDGRGSAVRVTVGRWQRGQTDRSMPVSSRSSCR